MLAVIGAICFAVSSTLQHYAVHVGRGATRRPGSTAPSGSGCADVLGARQLGTVVRRPPWLIGLGLAGAGTAVHAVALLLAPLRVVQPIGALALPLTVLITAARSGRRPTAGVVAGTAISIIGVLIFVLVSAGSVVSYAPSWSGILLATIAVAAVVAALSHIGLRTAGRWRAVLLAAAGAAAFGLVSSLVRAVSYPVLAGEIGLLDIRLLAAVAAIGAVLGAGVWLIQQAYLAGAPEIVIGALAVIDPIVAIILGALLLGEGAGTTPSATVILCGGAILAVGGVLLLARHHPDAAVVDRPELVSLSAR
ncbi:hypothetical protein [Millisia brevis]|uniref:hypothetical protein n=1 Tax=Millisia brevis TaxID=264148 RepID=UPI0012ED54E2|nr:hypothetical protein [Millisia brevis]